MTAGLQVQVTVVFSPSEGQVDCVTVLLPAGSRVAQAVAASGLAQRYPAVATLPAGIWGRVAMPDAEVREGDRIEVYRALVFDPMESRRRRQAHRAAAGPRRPKPRGGGVSGSPR